MGGRAKHQLRTERKRERRIKSLERELREERAKTQPLYSHPNLDLPRMPKTTASPTATEVLVRWTCNACAALISPKQEPGEDDEIECVDAAAAMRALADVLLEKT